MRRALLALAAALVVVGSVVSAQEDDRPTLSVAAFAASRSALSLQEAAELADDLAARLVDTGRFRVLPREWLPAPTGPAEASRPAALREAATLAGIAYLVVPSGSRPAPPSFQAKTRSTVRSCAEVGATLSWCPIIETPTVPVLKPPVCEPMTCRVTLPVRPSNSVPYLSTRKL